MTFALWTLGVIALLYVLDLAGLWLWLLDRVMSRVGVPVPFDGFITTGNITRAARFTVRRSGRFCRAISTLPTAVVPAAITIGNTVVLNDETPLTRRLLQHEAAHVRQWQKGAIRFLVLYCWYQVRYDYEQNPMEKEAEAAEEQP